MTQTAEYAGSREQRSQPATPGPALRPEPTARARPIPATLLPITDADLHGVGLYLGAHYPPLTPGDQWGDAWRSSVNLPGSEAPNHGFMLKGADGRVVGVYLAIYSVRIIDGRREKFCNLAGWYVLPDYRMQSLHLQRALLAQPGYTFTDLSPKEVVQKINLRLGFQYLNHEMALIPNVPWPSMPGRASVSDDPAVIEAALTGEAKQHYLDHAPCRWARHLVLVQGDESCHIVWRMSERKGMPVIWIQHASNPALLRRAYWPVGSYFLVRQRAPFTVVELRVAGGRIQPSLLRKPSIHARMFRSETLAAEQIDYLYSEIVSVP